jgi:MFS family permease
MNSAQRWLVLALLCLVRTAVAFQFQSVAALAPDLVARLGIDYARLGTLIGLYMLPGIVVAVPGGMLGQRFGDKRVVMCGLALMVAGGALTGLAETYWLAIAGRLIGGAGGVLVNVLLTKMVTDWFAGREIGTALSLLVASWPLGMGAALVADPWLASAHTPQLALHGTALTAGLLLLAVALAYRSPPGAGAAARPVGPMLRLGLSRREFGLVTLAGLVWGLFNLGYNLLVAFAPAMLIADGTSPTAAGLATSLATWATIVFVPVGGVVLDRGRSATSLMGVSFAVLAAAMLLAPVAAPLTMIAAVGLIGGLPAGAIMTLPAEVLRASSRGPGMGVFFAWYYLVMAVVPPFAGATRDITGVAGAPVACGGVVEILALLALVLFRLWQARPAPLAAPVPQHLRQDG